ncbi:hypothetical protein GF348_24115 [candidate division KSB3 bacterium]|nr:hypothetical protein [candidate division KSB3 bacterium]
MAPSESLKIFRQACDGLGAVLTGEGFTYRKSKRDARRQGALFEHIITFGTSRSINALPGHIHLEVRALAWSTELAAYREKAGISLPINEAVLFATTIENIFHPAPPYIRYDIGDPNSRADILQKVEVVLLGDVLRAFDLVESPGALRTAVDDGAMPCLSQAAIRDYFDCFQKPPITEQDL